MSLQVRNPSTGLLERVAGFNDTDIALSPTSVNPVANKTIYAALAQKIDKTVNDLINYYKKSETYSQEEVRALIGAINTLTIEVVSALPTEDISTTTIYFVGPAAGTNTYDEYVYVNNTWVQIGDTSIDLTDFVKDSDLTTVLQSYYTKTEIDNILDDYYDKDAVDDLLDTKQNTLTFDNTPISGSSNPVTSAGIKTALDNILISGNGGSIIKVHHLAGSAAAGNTVTASKGSYSVSSTFDVSGDAIIIGFGEIGNVTITATNGSETGSTVINIPNFSVYTARIGYGLDYKSWLMEGGLDPSYYSSLDEVLEDEEVVRRLMTIHASVDYLTMLNNADDEMAIAVLNNDICAKWINLRDYALDTLYANEYTKAIMDEADKYGYGEWALVGQVPTMTSNTAPYGEVTCDSFYDAGYEAYRAFDNSPSVWASNHVISPGSSASGWIKYKFIQPIHVNKMYLAFSGCELTALTIYGSNDDNNYTAISYISKSNGYYEFYNNDNSYQYYRVNLTQKWVSTGTAAMPRLNTLQFYAWQPKGNVPIMTSNTAPYGTAIRSGIYSSNEAWKAFDGNEATYWQGANMVSSSWVGYMFTNPINVKAFKIDVYPSNVRRIITFQIEASNDNSTWTPISEIYTMGSSEVTYGSFVPFNNNQYYLGYRVHTLTTTSSYEPLIGELQFYGREMKASIPAMTDYTVPYGTATESTLYSTSYNVVKALDQQGNSTWSHSTAGVPQWIGYEFVKPVIVKMARIKPYSGSDRTDNVTLKIQAFDNDTNTWIDLTDLDIYYGNIDKTSSINNINAYSKYRIYSTDTNYVTSGSKYVRFNRVQLYGFDYSERDWDTEHPMTYLYDHGVEPTDVITSIANASGNTFVKEPSRLTINKTSTSAWNAMYPTNQINVTDYTLARAVSTDGTGINGTASLATCSNLSTGATDSYKVMATNLAPYHQYNNMANVNTNRWVTIGFGTDKTGNIAISEWWLE